MNKSLILYILLLTGFASVNATKTWGQADSLQPSKGSAAAGQYASGKVEFFADSSIVNLEKGSRKFKEIKGYRIQIFLGGIDQVKSERNKYLALGLPYSVYQKQIVPEQALQVGDFTNRMEMEKHLEIIKKYYPKAFGVVEIIEPPKFTRSKKGR